jgi:hypothetical protein
MAFIAAGAYGNAIVHPKTKLKINHGHNLFRVQRPRVLGSGHGGGSKGSRFGLGIVQIANEEVALNGGIRCGNQVRV